MSHIKQACTQNEDILRYIQNVAYKVLYNLRVYSSMCFGFTFYMYM